jgi:hypothetical protein
LTSREPSVIQPHLDRGCSSVGRALQSHCRGQGFESPQLHHASSRARHLRSADAPDNRYKGIALDAASPATRQLSGIKLEPVTNNFIAKLARQFSLQLFDPFGMKLDHLSCFHIDQVVMMRHIGILEA